MLLGVGSGHRVRNGEAKLSLGKGSGGGTVLICPCFSLSKLILTGNKLVFPKLSLVLPVGITAKWSPCLYLDPQAFPSYFLSPFSWGGGVKGQLGGCLAVSKGKSTTNWPGLVAHRLLFKIWKCIYFPLSTLITPMKGITSPHNPVLFISVRLSMVDPRCHSWDNLLRKLLQKIIRLQQKRSVALLAMFCQKQQILQSQGRIFFSLNKSL